MMGEPKSNENVTITIEDLLQDTSNDNKISLNDNTFNLDDLLNEYNLSANIGKKNSKDNNIQCGFEQSPQMKAANTDDDIRRILEEAEVVYKKDTGGENSLRNTIQTVSNGEDQSAFVRSSRKRKEECQLSYQNPIEFINYMETVHVKSQIEANESIFPIKNYKQHCKVKVSVFEFQTKMGVSENIFKEGTGITCLYVNKGLIFTGTNTGRVKAFSSEKESNYQVYACKEIDPGNQISVVCMDVSQSGDFLICGYSNGNVALWETHTAKCRKLVTNAHNSCILACKFIHCDKNKCKLLSSDLDGNVVQMTIEDGFFSVSVDIISIIRNNIPIFLINILNFTDEEKKQYEFSRTNSSVIVAFGCLDFILIYMLEPKTKRLFKFERPKLVKDKLIPDMCFGIGYLPKVDDEHKVRESTYTSKVDYDNPQTLLAIAWGNIIYLFCIPIIKGVFHSFVMIGHYINNSVIKRIGFLASSVLCFYDKQKFIKAINTSLILPGEVKISLDTGVPIQVTNIIKPELEEGRIVSPDVLYQSFLRDDETSYKATYINYIILLPKTIYLLSKTTLYQGTLLNWNECLIRLFQSSEWIEGLTLGLDIYHGKAIALAGVPISKTERQRVLQQFLKECIRDYVAMHVGNASASILVLPEKSHQEQVSLCINICIEFCIEIDAVDYLFSEILSLLDSKGCTDAFILQLEPFILCDKLINEQLGENIISLIFEVYVKNRKYGILSQLIFHLSFYSIDIIYVKQKCTELNLINSLIYIYMNGSDEDYFFPLQQIYHIWGTAKEIPQSEFISYTNCLNTIPQSELEMSRQYLGHKLLWYVNLCLSGKRYPGTMNMNETKFEKLVSRVTLWLLSDEVLPIFLNFDSNALFLILTRIFKEDKLIGIVSFNGMEAYTQYSFNLTGANGVLPEITPTALVDHVVYKCKSMQKITILQDMSEFVLKVDGTLHLRKSLIVEACKYLLSFNDLEKERTLQSCEDMFNSEINMNAYITSISDTIIAMMNLRRDFEINDYTDFLGVCEQSPFAMVKIHLLKKLRMYRRCMEVLFMNEGETEAQVFQWINTALSELHDTDLIGYESLKEEVLNFLPNLAELSIDGIVKMVDKWYYSQQDVVIKKLGNVKHLQLEYVEKILDKYKEENFEGSYIESNMDHYIWLLKIHCKLLCKLKKQEQILMYLKKRQYYPPEYCLKKCIKAKVYDAAIYLYQKTGALKEALALACQVLHDNFLNIINHLTSTSFKENVHSRILEEHKNNLEICVNICETHSEKLTQVEEEDMWLSLLTLLYHMVTYLKENSKDMRRNYFDEFGKRLYSEIKDILDKMCSYVSIPKIIENVTENYKHAEFKEFKKVLLKMLASYSHLETVLVSAKNLSLHNVVYKLKELKKTNQKGNKFKLSKCDQCFRHFSHRIDESIYAFRCGHKYHITCAYSEEEENIGVMCQVCFRNEIEINPSTGDSSLVASSVKDIKTSHVDVNTSIYETKGKFHKDKQIRRLKTLDRYFNENSSLVTMLSNS